MSESAADELQRVFKTLSDPTRLRILSLLERETLVVQELMEVLGMAQSRVSRHLAILREAGLLDDRRDGTFVSYRFAPPEEGALERGLAHRPRAPRDRSDHRARPRPRSSTSGSTPRPSILTWFE